MSFIGPYLWGRINLFAPHIAKTVREYYKEMEDIEDEKPESYPFYLRHDKNGPGPTGFGKTNVQGVATIMALAVSKNLTLVCGPGIPSYCSSVESK